ncbi:MAG TPA: TonB-dependent receptor [Bacteroidales bacterium]|nr:TonB-dependent receptor [Bacteroidales bacterium]
MVDRKIILAPEYLFRKSDARALMQQQQQQITVTGKVTDSQTGEPMAGVNVVVKGTTIGTMTDAEGNYSLNVPDRNATLVFSFIGYTTQEMSLAGRTSLNVSLVSEAIGLEEVVVVGYGTQKKANLTGAVDQVTTTVLENRMMLNLTQGLKGAVPNLNISLLDGKPIQAPSYNIRGTTSIGQGGSALVLIDGVEGDPGMLNPNDIASISILKDAASSSIYGARGAFGVVLITTKNPSKEKTIINYSANFALRSPIAVPDLVTDGYTFAKMFAESFYNWENTFPTAVNKTLKFSQSYLDELKRRAENPSPSDKEVEIDPVTGDYVYYASHDKYRELYKDHSTGMEHNLSISGSTQTASFMITGRLLSQEGLFRYNSDDYSMYNIRSKGSVQVYKWLRIDNNSEYSEMKYHNPLNVGEGSGIWRNIADEGHVLAPMFNPDGTLTMSAAYNVGDFWYGKNGYNFYRRILRNTSGFEAQFFDNTLRLRGDFTFRNTDYSEQRRQVPVPYSNHPGIIAYVGTTTNDLREINDRTNYYATNLYAEYENILGEYHYIKVLAGYNYEQSTYKRVLVQRNGLIFEDATDINLALGQSITTSGGWDRWNILGGFGRINYSFKDRYLIEINGRYDGSSKFPGDQRFAFFPSYSIGWRISKEPFLILSNNIISDLKIRASYGSLGNGNISSYSFQEQFSISQLGRVLNAVKPQYTRNPSVLPAGLTWETATTLDFGLDLVALSDKLRIVGDMYIRKTTDMYTIGMTLPAVFGATPPKGNYADMKTKGWEVSILWRDRFNLVAKKFNYELRASLSDYNTIIEKYNNPEKVLTDYYEGMAMGEIWGFVTEGFFVDAVDITNHAQQDLFKSTSSGAIYPGDIKLKDLDNSGRIDYGTNRVGDTGDKIIIGNSTPRYTFSINFNADWNNFFLSAFFQGVGKQDWWPSTEAGLFWGQYNRPYNAVPKWQLGNYWTPENTNAYLPRYVSRLANRSGAMFVTGPQTKYLQNIAYIRLKNFQFGYNLPQSIISKIRASSLKIYFSGENIWTYSPLFKTIGSSHLDVENTGPSDQLFTSGNAGDGYNYPMMKNISFGLSVTF